MIEVNGYQLGFYIISFILTFGVILKICYGDKWNISTQVIFPICVAIFIIVGCGMLGHYLVSLMRFV